VVSKSLDAEPPDVPHGSLSVLAALSPWPTPASLLFQASRISSKTNEFFQFNGSANRPIEMWGFGFERSDQSFV
jgi:hypothetical protein